MSTITRKLTATVSLLGAISSAYADDFCPKMQHDGVIQLNFNPAMLHIDYYQTDPDLGVFGLRPGLTVSSFYNAYPNPNYIPGNPASGAPFDLFERDLVARIPEIHLIEPDDIGANDVEVLTDQHLPLGNGNRGDGNTYFAANTVWPNEARKVPNDVFDFEAVIIPQGFHPALKAGRLSLVDLSNPNQAGFYPEYVVHQSGTGPGNPDQFYHNAEFIDMNQDGRKDIVTVRSRFRVGASFAPPAGDLVWFEQPENYDGSQAWTEHRIYSMPFPGTGPDIHLRAGDLDGDGIEEIVATHFFTGDLQAGETQPAHGKIVLYAVPAGLSSWANVGFGPGLVPPVMTTLTDTQGYPFDIELVDLNRDGKTDILATNHQPVPMFTQTPGRVLAFEQPASGKLHEDAWTTHILKDDIWPNANLPGTPPLGRLAPGAATAFHPSLLLKHSKPWILVSGDEASKVWVLKPKNQNKNSWEYESAVIFDINDSYGEGTTQTPTEDGITISTIGRSAIRYNLLKGGKAEVYIPVFEAKDIHVLSFGGPRHNRIICPGE